MVIFLFDIYNLYKMYGLGGLKNIKLFSHFGFTNRFWTFINVQNQKAVRKTPQKLYFLVGQSIMVSFLYNNNKSPY
jgi:hypothetical protein